METEGGAWCPVGVTEKGSRHFLEIDLTSVHVITYAGTQGRFGNGNGKEYTENYRLEYWRPGLPDFVVFTNSTNGNQVSDFKHVNYFSNTTGIVNIIFKLLNLKNLKK